MVYPNFFSSSHICLDETVPNTLSCSPVFTFIIISLFFNSSANLLHSSIFASSSCFLISNSLASFFLLVSVAFTARPFFIKKLLA